MRSKKPKTQHRTLGGKGWIPGVRDLQYIQEVAQYAYTKSRIARQLSTTVKTLLEWCQGFPEVLEAIMAGREESVQKVEDALYSIATSGRQNKVTLDACIYYLDKRGQWGRYPKQVEEKYDVRKALKMKEVGAEEKKREVPVTLKLIRNNNTIDIRKPLAIEEG